MNSTPERDTALASVDVQRLVLPCPCCGDAIKYSDEIWFNGGGPPPSDAVSCGTCGCRGGFGHGRHRGDYIGSIMDAISIWNAMPRRQNKEIS